MKLNWTFPRTELACQQRTYFHFHFNTFACTDVTGRTHQHAEWTSHEEPEKQVSLCWRSVASGLRVSWWLACSGSLKEGKGWGVSPQIQKNQAYVIHLHVYRNVTRLKLLKWRIADWIHTKHGHKTVRRSNQCVSLGVACHTDTWNSSTFLYSFSLQKYLNM